MATNPSAFGEEAVSLKDAWGFYDAFLEDERVVYLAEPEAIESMWRSYTATPTFSPKIWSDAFLAAFAATAKSRLVSFDRAMSQFSQTQVLILS